MQRFIDIKLGPQEIMMKVKIEDIQFMYIFNVIKLIFSFEQLEIISSPIFT